MKQKILLSLVIISLIPLSTANILIEPPQTEKDLQGLETGFELGFVNTGSESVNLSFSSQKTTDIQLQHPQQIELPVSQITSSPEGSNWYYLGDGNYAKINYVTIDAEIPLDTDTRRHNFDFSISRVYETSEARPNVEQVQELNFEIFSTSDRINTGFQSPNEETTDDQEGDMDSNETTSSSEENTQQEEQPAENVNQSISDTEETPSEQGVNRVTILLIAGIILCAAWLIKEVF